MRCRLIMTMGSLAFSLAVLPVCAQRHGGSSSAPPARPAPQPIVAVSSGIGPIQFVAVNYGVPAPQSLTRQLRADDERTRAAALSAIGAPGQYLQRGHIAMPHSINLEFAALGSNDDLEAVLTVELDQHIVSAILLPDESNWRRIATVMIADSADDPATTPSTFFRTAPSFLQRGRYRAVYRAASVDPQGNYIENEADIRIINERAIITMSFASGSRTCTSNPGATAGKHADPGGCNIMRRWFKPDTGDPAHHFNLVTASGHLSAHEATDLLGNSREYESTHLRNFSCQPFLFSDTTLRFEPTGNNVPCPVAK